MGAASLAGEDQQRLKLQIVVPALNEEDSIGSIIERCLAAVPEIVASTPVTDVAITVVSDGSTDRTVEIAVALCRLDHADRVREEQGLRRCDQRRWRRSDADLLAFLDADGTCDPTFFVPLCNAVVGDGVAVALGCRLNSESEMPRLRRVGNTLFALAAEHLVVEQGPRHGERHASRAA